MSAETIFNESPSTDTDADATALTIPGASALMDISAFQSPEDIWTRVVMNKDAGCFEFQRMGTPAQEPTMSGMLIGWRPRQRLFQGGYNPANIQPPLCASDDGVNARLEFDLNNPDIASRFAPLLQKGHPTPESCRQCPQRAANCKSYVDLVFLPEDTETLGSVPMSIQVPPAGIRPTLDALKGLMVFGGAKGDIFRHRFVRLVAQQRMTKNNQASVFVALTPEETLTPTDDFLECAAMWRDQLPPTFRAF